MVLYTCLKGLGVVVGDGVLAEKWVSHKEKTFKKELTPKTKRVIITVSKRS